MVHGLDCEQIWQQLELRNSSKSTLITCTRNAVKIQSRNSKRLKAPRKEKKSMKKVISEEEKDISEEQENSDSSDGEENILNSIKSRLEDDNSSEDDTLFKGLDNLDDEENDEDEDDVDFDFKVNDELVKGYSESDIHGDGESKTKTTQDSSKLSSPLNSVSSSELLS